MGFQRTLPRRNRLTIASRMMAPISAVQIGMGEAIQFARELSAANPANGTYEIRPLQFFNPGVPIA